MNELVSVYIVTCERYKLLERCVESVLNQSYDEIEILIVDDCSQDETAEYLKQLEIEGLAKVFINNERRGAPYSRNIAIQNATGEFITGIDDDDYMGVDRVSRFIDAWQVKEPDVVALYSDVCIVEKNERYKTVRKKKFVSFDDMWKENYIGNQVFTQTCSLKDIGGFDEALPAWQDFDCWLRLLSIRMGDRTVRASRVNFSTYYMDCSHGFERISDGKAQRIERAYSHFLKKYDLSERQRSYLKLQLLAYQRSNFNIVDLCVSLIGSFSIFSITKIMKLLLRKMIR